MGGSYVSDFVHFRTEIGSNSVVLMLSGPLVHYCQLHLTRIQTGPFGKDFDVKIVRKINEIMAYDAPTLALPPH